jgi:hypothetical protein
VSSEKCRGFDFHKKFPGDSYHRFPTWVTYDTSFQWETGKDGVNFHGFYWKDSSRNTAFYRELRQRDNRVFSSSLVNSIDQEYLPRSEREQRYLARYEQAEKEFDRRYAGEIKKKVLQKAVRQPWPERSDGRKRLVPDIIKYPTYLEGDRLPEGVETPATFFSHSFFRTYIYAKNREEYLGNQFLKLHSASHYDGIEGTVRWIASNISKRFELVFAEYVLTYHYLKQYVNEEFRRQTVHDLAEYYSSVAFRAAAETLYMYPYLLSGHERCLIADYVAQRVNDYIITAFENPGGLARIKKEYEKELEEICHFALCKSRQPEFRSLAEQRHYFRECLERVRISGEDCIND